MTEIYGLFDAADPEAPDRVYTSEAFARLFRTIMRDGIVHNDGDELAVSPTVPAAMSVDVGTGMALVQGRYYINSADLTLTVEAADPSYPRIDRVVVRADLVGRTVHAVVKKGTAAASPVAPALTRTTETWELSLAQVRVEAGATSILSAKITDERGNANLCGVAAPVYVPSSQLEVVGAVDMQGKALTGLPAPSGSADAARKGYVDAEIAAKIGGFGISQIAIDADKDWNGKSITNVGTISCIKIAPDVVLEAIPERSKTLFHLQIHSGANQYETVTSPVKTFNRISGTGQVTIVITATKTPASGETNTYRLYKNGVVIWSVTVSPEGYDIPAISETLTVDVKTGDKIHIEMVPSRLATTMTATASAAISIPLLDGIIS